MVSDSLPMTSVRLYYNASELEMMLLLQQYCKAMVSAFSSGQTTDVSWVSERVTPHTISSSWLIFLHPRLTFHVLCMHKNLCIYLVGAEWCSGSSWPAVSLETGSHQKGSPQKETGWTALMYRSHWPLLLEDSAESLQPPAQGTLESTHVGAWVGRNSETWTMRFWCSHSLCSAKYIQPVQPRDT